MTAPRASWHPRVSVSGLCSYHQSLTDDVAMWRRLGVTNVGVPVKKLDVDVGRAAGVRVSNVIGPGRDHVPASIDAAAALDAGCVVFTTGRALPATWEDNLAAFETDIAGVGDRSRLALEHTNSLRPDVGFVHTLRDALDVAERVGVGVVVELNACWLERDVEATIRRALPLVRLVQVSDFVIGTTCTPDRAVPGDGDIPLDRLLGAVLDAGYEGDVDLEVVGPRVEAEGYEAAIRRSAEWLSSTLDRLGA